MTIKNHLDIAKALWKEVLPGVKFALDCTLGNGHDALFLAQNLLKESKKHFFGIDIQTIALEKTKERLQSLLPPPWFERIHLQHGCHSMIDQLFPNIQFDFICYNLGYLPNSDHVITTKVKSTLQSLQRAKNSLTSKGSISITAYPGHEEGNAELKNIQEFLLIEKAHFHIHYCRRFDDSKGPVLFHLQKRC